MLTTRPSFELIHVHLIPQINSLIIIFDLFSSFCPNPFFRRIYRYKGKSLSKGFLFLFKTLLTFQQLFGFHGQLFPY